MLMEDKTKNWITIISLIIGLVGAVSSLVSSVNAREQVKIQYEQNESRKANLTIILDDNACIFPIKGQHDKITERNMDDFNYRIADKIELINQSSLPLGIISMHIELKDKGIALHQETNVSRYISSSEKVDEKIVKYSRVELTNNQYREVFTLSPYEATDKYAIFVTNVNPDCFEDSFDAELVIATSRGVFKKTLKINKTSGLIDLN